MCTAFGHASNNLYHDLAAVARKLCTQSVDPNGIEALVPCCFIPLDKSPGIRPMGYGEVSRRIIAKAVMRAVKDDVWGQEGGVETTTHAISELFHHDEAEAVLLADASNAFNTLNGNCT